MNNREGNELVRDARRLSDEQIKRCLEDLDDVASDTHRSRAHRDIAQASVVLLESVLEERREEEREERAAQDFDNSQTEYWK